MEKSGSAYGGEEAAGTTNYDCAEPHVAESTMYVNCSGNWI